MSWRNLGGLMAAGSLAASTFVLTALPAAATIDKGSCTGGATASHSGSVNFVKAAKWEVVNADVINGHGEAKTEQTFVRVGAVVFGIDLPVYSSTGKNTKGSAGPYNVSDYSRYGRVIDVSGSTDDCHGSLTIIIKDASPWTNAISLVGLALILLGLLILLTLARSRPNIAKHIVGTVAGALVGLGVGLLLIELEVIDPSNLVGATAPVFGAILGTFIPGFLYHPKP